MKVPKIMATKTMQTNKCENIYPIHKIKDSEATKVKNKLNKNSINGKPSVLSKPTIKKQIAPVTIVSKPVKGKETKKLAI